MEKFTSARAQPAKVTPEGSAADSLNQQIISEVRALEEWELTMVGGGEDMVCW
jgi:hypothetical protein